MHGIIEEWVQKPKSKGEKKEKVNSYAREEKGLGWVEPEGSP